MVGLSPSTFAVFMIVPFCLPFSSNSLRTSSGASSLVMPLILSIVISYLSSKKMSCSHYELQQSGSGAAQHIVFDVCIERQTLNFGDILANTIDIFSDLRIVVV